MTAGSLNLSSLKFSLTFYVIVLMYLESQYRSSCKSYNCYLYSVLVTTN